MKYFLILAMALLAPGCATYNLAGKIYMKRDRFGESPVVDLRDMASMYQWNYDKKK
jgi:hypothetical protein